MTPLWLLLGCTGTLSNAPFIEDALFLSALPERELLEMSYPGDLSEMDADLLAMSLGSLESTVELTATVLSVTETIRAVAPTERGEHHRVWGPGAWDAQPGSFLRVEMTRTTDKVNYLYTFQAGATTQGPWMEFFEGAAVLSDADDAPLSQGSMAWHAEELDELIPDHGTQSTRMEFVHQANDTLSLDVLSPLVLSVATQADGSGQLSVSALVDLDEEPSAPEDFELLTRWDSAGLGRADLWVHSGDTHWQDARLWQCWDAGGVSTWFASDPQELVQESGEMSSCVFE